MNLAGFGWPDLLIGAIVVFGALKGFKRGFVSELTGAIALVAGIVAAFRYTGDWDAWVAATTHLGPGSAHVVAMSGFAAVWYALVFAVGMVLGRFAKLPIIGTVNALLGSGVGALKAIVGVWALLYIALFFPLSRDLRADLHRSQFAPLLTAPNVRIDGALRGSLPWFVRPFAGTLFARHNVNDPGRR